MKLGRKRCVLTTVGLTAACLTMTFVPAQGIGHGETLRLSQDPSGAGGNRESSAPSISHDGSYIVFHSIAENLGGGIPSAQRTTWV